MHENKCDVRNAQGSVQCDEVEGPQPLLHLTIEAQVELNCMGCNSQWHNIHNLRTIRTGRLRYIGDMCRKGKENNCRDGGVGRSCMIH